LINTSRVGGADPSPVLGGETTTSRDMRQLYYRAFAARTVRGRLGCPSPDRPQLAVLPMLVNTDELGYQQSRLSCLPHAPSLRWVAGAWRHGSFRRWSAR
jgi:hypothetical protein